LSESKKNYVVKSLAISNYPLFMKLYLYMPFIRTALPGVQEVSRKCFLWHS